MVSIDPVYFKALMLAISPYASAIIIIIVWLMMRKIYKWDDYSNLYLTLLITFNYLQPSLVISNSKLITCTELDQNLYFLSSNLSIECYTSDHLLYVDNKTFFFF